MKDFYKEFRNVKTESAITVLTATYEAALYRKIAELLVEDKK